MQYCQIQFTCEFEIRPVWSRTRDLLIVSLTPYATILLCFVKKTEHITGPRLSELTDKVIIAC